MAHRKKYRAARWRIGRRSCSTPCARAPGLPTTMLFGRAEPDAFLSIFWRNMDAWARPRHPTPMTGFAVPPGHSFTRDQKSQPTNSHRGLPLKLHLSVRSFLHFQQYSSGASSFASRKAYIWSYESVISLHSARVFFTDTGRGQYNGPLPDLAPTDIIPPPRNPGGS
jgi:hypothetical protein